MISSAPDGNDVPRPMPPSASPSSAFDSLEAIWRLTRRRMKRPFFVRMPREMAEAYRADRARTFRQRIGIVINVFVAVVALYVLLSLRLPGYVRGIPRESLYLAILTEIVIFLVSRRTLGLRSLQLLALCTLFVPLMLIFQLAAPQSAFFLIIALAMGFLYPWNAIEAIGVTIAPTIAYILRAASGAPPTATDFVAFALTFGIIVVFQLERERERRVSYVMETEASSARAELEESLRLAARLHADIISDNVDTDRLAVRIQYEPMQHLGGDYVKVVAFPEGPVSMFLADVTGHGAPAALMINRINGLVERLMAEKLRPLAASAELSERVYRIFSGSGMLMSALWAEFDPEAGTVRWLNHGHPPAMLLRANSPHVERLGSQAPLMGVARPDYRDRPEPEFFISPGDLVFFYTDGLIECEVDGERFDLDRLEGYLGAFAAQRQRLSAEELLAEIGRKTRDWRGDDRRDDLLMAVWEVR